MAKKNNSARRHSSPRLYFTDTVVNYATKSLGITSLGVVGETLRGRAFEPTEINDWGEFIYNFGGTSTEKYRGSQYPKYELPYIAQSYLEESHNLKVVKVLGLSGVNAGPAWVITAKSHTVNDEYDNMVVMVLRSRGEHKKMADTGLQDECGEPIYEYDGIKYYAYDISLVPSKTLNLDGNCNPGYNANEEGHTGSYFNSTSLNYGMFTISVTLNNEKAGTEEADVVNYSVTLNPSDKNYIYNVIGGDPEKGDAEVYVEELYDVALRQLVDEHKIDGIYQSVIKYEDINIVPEHEDVYDLLSDAIPTRDMLGRRYLYSTSLSQDENGNPITVRTNTGQGWGSETNGVNGIIYTVYTDIDSETGKRKYFYGVYMPSEDVTYTYTELTGDELAELKQRKIQFNGSGSATWQTPQTAFCDANSLPEATYSSPRYVATGVLNFKIVSETDAALVVRGTKHLKDVNGLTTCGMDDYLVVESPTGDNLCASEIRFNIKYNSVNVDKHEEQELAGNTKAYGISLTDLFDNDEIRYSQLFSLEFPDETYYEKIASIPSSDSDKPEYLEPYDYSQQVVNGKFTNCVRVVAQDSFYINNSNDVEPITLDFNNYKEQYRWAVSPWIVSEMKGSANNVVLNKLFRFHSISDGTNSTTEFKISIENIDTSTGKFDVVVRDYYDSDLSVNAYEKFLSCDLVPGSPNYIALKIGSTDGMYNSKSRYVTVEVIESDEVKNSIPAGFLGYPIRDYSGYGLTPVSTTPKPPYFRFNTNIDEDVKPKKQYFGVSDLVGIDEDVFKYKGVEAYDGNPNGLTPCFHLDARILNGTPNSNGVITVDNIGQTVSVDGVTGYSWVTVGKNNTVPNASRKIEPRIGDEATMIDTIYEDKAYRKFTVCMYGGWDGWDYYRTTRSNGNEFSYKEYKGAIDTKSGYGSTFSVYSTPEALGFDNTIIITSDYYAYLGGAKLLGNPKSVTVNVLATPGIDYVNNKNLVEDIIDIVEEERGDLIYVITTPDKPSGAGDSVDEMYTPQDAVYNLEDSDIDSNHCCTYYPWVKYYDNDNYQYVYLPLTRDVVRSIAYTDNVKFSWYANAGWNRGNIPDNASPKKKLTLNEQDTLYDGRINFVNSFAEEGNKIWGDKNLQIDDNLLNRISKRRLLLRIRTMLQNACIGLIFDPNDLTMSQTVRSAVSKVLDDVKTGRGITDYKIEIDDSAETRDQLGLNVTYHIKPIQALEWINFTSVLTPEGMEWQ